MKKIIVKLSDPRVKKFRLQRNGWKGRRFIRAISLLRRLENILPRKGNEEKTAIVVKEYIDGHFKIINESLDSSDTNYLIYTTACFLEDYLSDSYIKEAEERYFE